MRNSPLVRYPQRVFTKKKSVNHRIRSCFRSTATRLYPASSYTSTIRITGENLTKKTEAKIREYLDLVIAFKLKVAEAHGRGIDTTKAFVTEFTTYRDELKKPYVASQDELSRLVKEHTSE